MMADRKRAEETPVTYKKLELLIDKFVEQQRAFLLAVARHVVFETEGQGKPTRSPRRARKTSR